ncbi:MAG: hypothetical protein K2Y23_16005 [Cyanobacteria bacterium]|nr:hypothetical protein [Cyanobacteriota bacterium]
MAAEDMRVLSEQNASVIARMCMCTIAYMLRGMRGDKLVLMPAFATVYPPIHNGCGAG